MKKLIISALKYILFLAIGIGLVWWQVSGMTQEEKQQFVTSLESANFIYLIPILIMGLLSHYFRAVRWKLLIDPIKPVSSRNAFYSTLVGYLGNTFLPRAGEVFRCTVLGKYERVPFSKLLGTVIVERTFDLICYILFIVLTVIVQLDIVGGFVSDKFSEIFSNRSGFPLWAKMIILATTLILVFIVTNWIFKKYPDNKPVKKIKSIWNGLKEGLTTVLHLNQKGRFLIYTFLIWLMYLSQIYLGFQTIGVTEHLGAGAAMSVLTLSTLAMIISPGGLGAFPIAVQQVLLVYHVNNISFGWLVWGINTIIIILAGSISLVLIILQNRQALKKKYELERE